ncbi:hypothetical protein SEUCBS140593_005367 [Sporothrix eucalyptigena]|uniref:Major facilitator superfamily (MFS) profile domain-containing protein n=1 Tax=Sporothrix eucalyptigena TaxID=1812306 RepID=A0ABP0BVW1_9PEZI
MISDVKREETMPQTDQIEQADAAEVEMGSVPSNMTTGKPPPLPQIDRMLLDDERAPEARGAFMDSLPQSYWYSWQFIGTFIAIILAKDAGSGGFSLAAPVLANINAEIGPDPAVTWVSLAWTLTQGISTLVVGRLSDVFGPRWIFIVFSVIGTAGAIWASQAQSIKQLIGATVLLGIAGGVQISYFWIISEIVPMKWRFAANSFIYVCSFTSWLGPKISYDFFTQTAAGWRGSYYLLVALNGLSTILFWLCYHPPTFKMLHRRSALTNLVKTFDWVGLVLYTGSFVAFLIGLNWGGSSYPWGSAHVLGTLIGGIGGLGVFVGYEIWLAHRYKSVVPFVPMHFFTNFPLLAITGMTCVSGASYYGLASVWPGLVNNVWPTFSQSKTGNMLSLFVLTYLWGQVVGGAIAHFTGALFSWALEALRLVSWRVALTATTYPLRSQDEIGSAGGVTGTIRLFISTIATAAYNTTLNNRLAKTIPGRVGPAAEAAGLPASSVPLLIKMLKGTLPAGTNVPGLTDAITTVAKSAFHLAYNDAYRTLFFVFIAFTVPGVFLCWFVIDSDKSKDEFVAGHLHKRADERILEGDGTDENE